MGKVRRHTSPILPRPLLRTSCCFQNVQRESLTRRKVGRRADEHTRAKAEARANQQRLSFLVARIAILRQRGEELRVHSAMSCQTAAFINWLELRAQCCFSVALIFHLSSFSVAFSLPLCPFPFSVLLLARETESRVHRIWVAELRLACVSPTI